jgi:amino acid permease
VRPGPSRQSAEDVSDGSGAYQDPIEQSIADTEEPTHQLRKQLGPLDLTVFGVGVVIGTGIFVLTDKAVGVQYAVKAERRLLQR